MYQLVYWVGKDRYCKIFDTYEKAKYFVLNETTAYSWDITKCPAYFPATT